MEFASLGLNDHLLGHLASEGIGAPTPIQIAAIPAILAGRDVIGLAQTGTGKTAAYGLPLVHRLMALGRAPAAGAPRALVLAPSRELAGQIASVLTGYARYTHVKLATATGGAPMARQIERLATPVDILVATPGRLIDLLKRKALHLSDARHLILDEADKMLGLGFLPNVQRIAAELPARRQTLLFSATMPAEIEALARNLMTDPVRLAAAEPGRPAANIAQSVHFTSQRAKATVLRGYLSEHPDASALVFTATRDGAEKLAALMVHWGFAADALHADRSRAERDRVLAAFRTGGLNVLIATDLAARGLDIPGVGHVYNYDLPTGPEAYIHRIGRTARAGASGRAVSLCAPAEMEVLRRLEAQLGQPLPIAGGAPFDPAPQTAARSSRAGGKRPAARRAR